MSKKPVEDSPGPPHPKKPKKDEGGTLILTHNHFHGGICLGITAIILVFMLSNSESKLTTLCTTVHIYVTGKSCPRHFEN